MKLSSPATVLVVTGIVVVAAFVEYWLVPADKSSPVPPPPFASGGSGMCGYLDIKTGKQTATWPARPDGSCWSVDRDKLLAGLGGGAVTSISPTTCDDGYALVIKVEDMSFGMAGVTHAWCAKDLKEPHG